MPSRREVEEGQQVLMLPMQEARTQKATIKRIVTAYARGVEKLMLVTSLFLAADCKNSRAHIFNVLQRDTTVSEMGDPRFAKLTELGDDLERELENYLTIEVSLLNPSSLRELQETFKVEKIETATIECKFSKKPSLKI